MIGYLAYAIVVALAWRIGYMQGRSAEFLALKPLLDSMADLNERMLKFCLNAYRSEEAELDS